RTRVAAASLDWSWFGYALLPLMLLALAPMPARAQTPAAASATPTAPAAPPAPTVPAGPLPVVPNDVKTKPNITADRPQIEKFIDMACAQLAGGTPEQQTKARNALRD